MCVDIELRNREILNIALGNEHGSICRAVVWGEYGVQ